MIVIEALCQAFGIEPPKQLFEQLLRRKEEYLARRPPRSVPVSSGTDTAALEGPPTGISGVRPLRPFSTACHDSSEPIEGLYDRIGLFCLRALASPPSLGYEPMLRKMNFGPIPARELAYIAIRRGHRSANDTARRPAVVDAIRFLATPGHRGQSIARKAAVLLAACRQTSVIEEIFDDAGLHEGEFIKLLESAVDGDTAVHSRLCAIAATVATRLSVPRGPQISAASAAHELLSEEMGQGYTYSPDLEDFTDELTKATRIEFGDPNFDPRPAVRRARARQKRQKKS